MLEVLQTLAQVMLVVFLTVMTSFDFGLCPLYLIMC